MQINNFVVAGRLTKTVKYGATRNGIPAARFTLANNRGKHVNYFSVMAFNKIADYAKDYLHKGQRVTVQGVMQHTTTEANGNYNDYFTIIADTFDAIHPKQQSSSVKKLYAKFDDLSKKVDAASKGTRHPETKPKQHHKHKQTKKTARK